MFSSVSADSFRNQKLRKNSAETHKKVGKNSWKNEFVCYMTRKVFYAWCILMWMEMLFDDILGLFE